MKPVSLLLNNKSFTYENIKNGYYEPTTLFEKNTLDFCRQWLNGQRTFNQQTSGSTGKPKTIEIPRTQMRLSAQLTVGALGLQAADTALVCIDTAYIGGKMMLVRALEHHMQLVIIEPTSNPMETISLEPHFVSMVPMQVANTIENNVHKLKKCKGLLIGGAPINNELSKKLTTLATPIYNTYGMTETASHVALRRVSHPVEPYFNGLGDVHFTTTKDKRLKIKGSITQQKLLQTNDIVELHSQNSFTWLGRADNVINSGGIKIHPEQIEPLVAEVLDKINMKYRFFLAGTPNNTLGQQLILVVETTDKKVLAKINSTLSTLLSKYHRPKLVLGCSSFIETDNGKIQRLKTLKSCLL